MLPLVLLFLSVLTPGSSIQLHENGYTDILIVISPALPENEELIQQIKVITRFNIFCTLYIKLVTW